MKLRIFSPRLFLRAVRALEHIADALEAHRDDFRRVHQLAAPVTEVDDDTDTESLVSYSTDGASFARERRIAHKRAAGFSADPDDLAAGT